MLRQMMRSHDPGGNRAALADKPRRTRPRPYPRGTALVAASLLLVSALSGCTAGAGSGPLASSSSAFSGVLSCLGAGSAPTSLPGAASHVYKTASGRDLRVHVLQPADAFASLASSTHRPAILFFFGGGWRRGQVTQFLSQATAAAERGYVAVLADYRVACRDDTSVLDAVADAQDAYAWLRRASPELGVDPRRIVLAGGSAGGQLALVTALSAPAEARPAALVLFNPAVDLMAIAPWFGLPPEDVANISPSAMRVAVAPPMQLFHGDADRIVPVDTARAFCRKVVAEGGRCGLQEYPDQGHGFFNSHAKDATGIAPYDDTLARTFTFLDGLGLRSGSPLATGQPQ